MRSMGVSPEREICRYHAYITGRFEPSLVRDSPPYRAIIARKWIETGYEVIELDDGSAVTFFFERRSPSGSISAGAHPSAR